MKKSHIFELMKEAQQSFSSKLFYFKLLIKKLNATTFILVFWEIIYIYIIYIYIAREVKEILPLAIIYIYIYIYSEGSKWFATIIMQGFSYESSSR